MNKKGQIMEMMQYIPRVIVLAGLIFVVYAIVTAGIKSEIDITKTESQLIIQRILYSKQGLSYFDNDINRLIPGIIPLENFNDDYVTKIFGLPADDQHFTVRLTLNYYNDLYSEEKVVYLNKNLFDKWLPLSNKLGSGGKSLSQETFVVVVKEGDLKYDGNLLIEVLLSNV